MSGWSLRAKIVAVIVTGVLISGAAVLGADLASTGRTVRHQVQERFALAAAGKTSAAADTLVESLTVLRGVAADRAVVAACEAANAARPSGAATYIANLNPRWLRSGDDSQLVRSVTNPGLNPVTEQLRRHISGMDQYVQVLVTDDLGVAVAATVRPDMHYYGLAPWWSALQADETGRQHVDIYRPFGSPDAYAYVEVAVPVYRDARTRLDQVGAVYARVDVGPLVDAIGRTTPSDLAQTLILDEVGRAVVATDGGKIGSVVDTSWWQRQYEQYQHRHFHEARMVDGTPVLVGHAALGEAGGQEVDARDANTLAELPWVLYVYEPTQSAYAVVRQGSGWQWLLGGAGLVIAVAVGLVLAGVVTGPLQRLVTFAEGLNDADAAADADERVWVSPHREASALARALNGLLDERDALQSELSANRTQAAEDRARRQRDAGVAASIGALVAESTDVAVLSRRSVELVREHYNLYYVGLYLIDEASVSARSVGGSATGEAARGRWAVLQAGTGETGRTLLSQAHRVAVGGDADNSETGWAGSSLVGQCAASGRVQIVRDLDRVVNVADDVNATPSFTPADQGFGFTDGGFAPPEWGGERHLPYARAEMAVPLRSRGVVIGVLVADSYQAETFDDETVVAMRVIADQVAVAIDSLRLYAEGQAAAQRLQRAYGELTRTSWLEALGGQSGRGYEAMATGVTKLPVRSPEAWPVYLHDAWAEQRTVVVQTVDHNGVATQRCLIPIRIRDEVIGVLDVSKLASDGEWTPVELDELAGLSDQLGQALENARLYEIAQQNAMEEQMVGGITRRMRETLSVDTVLQTAVQELRTLLDLDGVEIRVGDDSEAGSAVSEAKGSL